jgi:hypothetical protein
MPNENCRDLEGWSWSDESASGFELVPTFDGLSFDARNTTSSSVFFIGLFGEIAFGSSVLPLRASIELSDLAKSTEAIRNQTHLLN